MIGAVIGAIGSAAASMIGASMSKKQAQKAQAQAEQQAKAQEQAGEEALSKIPPIQNKQGETIDYDWAKAPDIETALTAMRHLGYTNQDIVQFALTYTDTLVGRHKKLEKSTPKRANHCSLKIGNSSI
jgi:membrane protease subunit (stomatin/prohibitin family)